MNTQFYIVGTPIGNLEEITLRALRILKEVDLIYCEDTRRTLKLLNHFEIKKSLKSVPYFKERASSKDLIEELQAGKTLAYVSDAGMPNVSDPGAILVSAARQAGFKVEVIGGVSAMTSFLAGLGHELESFCFVGFLPAKKTQRQKLLEKESQRPILFFESTHRIQSTLELIRGLYPGRRVCLGKELSKLSEAFFEGTASELLAKVPSWKGEWVGLVFGQEY